MTPWPGWEDEPVNLYAMCALPPGGRKSAALRKALAPVKLLEKQARGAAEPAIAAAQSVHQIATKRVDTLGNQAAKCSDPAEQVAVPAELVLARGEPLACEVPAVPVWAVDDDTPEMLASELCRRGRLMAASAEAKALANIVRDDKADADILLKGHAGDDQKTGRTGRGREEADRVALSCAYTPQPAVLEGPAERPEMRERGFPARWLYALPASAVGYRDCSGRRRRSPRRYGRPTRSPSRGPGSTSRRPRTSRRRWASTPTPVRP